MRLLGAALGATVLLCAACGSTHSASSGRNSVTAKPHPTASGPAPRTNTLGSMRTVRVARAAFAARHLPLEQAGSHPFGRVRKVLYLQVKPQLKASKDGVRVSHDDFVVIVFPTPAAARRALDDPYVRKALSRNHEPAARNGNLVLASRVPVGRRYHNLADWRAARRALARIGS
jgi:hypothetical protein